MASANASLYGLPFFIVVWATERENPLYACASHIPPRTIHADESVPHVNLVGLHRFFLSLALLSAAPRESPRGTSSNSNSIHCISIAEEEHEENIRLASALVPSDTVNRDALVPCVFATTSHFHVAVLAARVGEKGACNLQRTRDMLKWVAVGVARVLMPCAWTPTTSNAAGAPLQLRGDPPGDLTSSVETPPLGDQLTQFWQRESAKSRAAAAAMMRYGAREVLAEGDADTSSLQAHLELSRQHQVSTENALYPAAAAIEIFLARWWWPLLSHTPHSAPSVRFRLAGFFAADVGGPPLKEPQLGLREDLQTPEPAPPPFSCLAPLDNTIRVMAAFCEDNRFVNQKVDRDKDAAHLTAVTVMPLSVGIALVAVDTGIAWRGHLHIFQVAFIEQRTKAGQQEDLAKRSTLFVHHLERSENFKNASATLWSEQHLAQLL